MGVETLQIGHADSGSNIEMCLLLVDVDGRVKRKRRPFRKEPPGSVISHVMINAFLEVCSIRSLESRTCRAMIGLVGNPLEVVRKYDILRLTGTNEKTSEQ